MVQAKARDTSTDTVNPGKLFCHWWEKKKEARGLAWALALRRIQPRGGRGRWEGSPTRPQESSRCKESTWFPGGGGGRIGLGQSLLRLNFVPTRDMLKS